MSSEIPMIGIVLVADYRNFGPHPDLISQYATELVNAKANVIRGGGGLAIRTDGEVLTFDEAAAPQFVKQCKDRRCVAGNRLKKAKTVGPPGFLGTRSERPQENRPGNGRNECAPPHAIFPSDLKLL
jgi:hypothetical protein